MTPPDILCIGAVLWDVIGRADRHMTLGDDVPGRITRNPGGVALNIAMTLRRFGLAPALLSAIGRDAAGDALIAACTRMGIDTAHVYRSEDLPTDRYMAIEGAGGLIAAIADAHSLEQAGIRILQPLIHGPLGRAGAPYAGPVALDGNLTAALLTEIAQSPAFAAADLRIAAASPDKADRLLPFLGVPGATLYVNLAEAGVICGTRFAASADAADAMRTRGAARVLVTDGPGAASAAGPEGLITAAPPQVMARRITGAGDTLMAAHIAAELDGADPVQALDRALHAAAAYITGEPSG